MSLPALRGRNMPTRDDYLSMATTAGVGMAPRRIGVVGISWLINLFQDTSPMFYSPLRTCICVALFAAASVLFSARADAQPIPALPNVPSVYLKQGDSQE